MERVNFLVSKYNSLPVKTRNKVNAYIPAIAGQSLSSMQDIGIMSDACYGADLDSTCKCFADAITFALYGDTGSVVVCDSRSSGLARVLGVKADYSDYLSVVQKLGYTGVEISKKQYDESPGEMGYTKVRRKYVEDTDGFETDYVWYKMNDGTHVFILGDCEVYNPSNHDFDHTCESEEEAEEWFNSYGEDLPEDDIVDTGAYDEEDMEEWDGTDSEESQTSEKDDEDIATPADSVDEKSNEKDDSSDDEPESAVDLDKEIVACFGNKIPNYVDKILNVYDLLYSSGFELRRPYGVLCSEGVYYVDSANHCAVRSEIHDMDFSTSIKMYSLFQEKLGFIEKTCRSTGVIGMEIVGQYMSNPSTVMYFPQKCLEIMYGRVPATAKKELKGEKIVYFAHSKNGNSWRGYRNDDVKNHLSKLLIACVRVYIERAGFKGNLRTINAINAVEGMLNYAISCLSSGILIIDYKTSNSSPVKFKVRVSDPSGKLNPSIDYAPEIISVAFAGNIGGKDSKSIKGGLNQAMSLAYRVYEYAHEFNHTLSNAMPLFAYKALETLLARGDKVSWKSAIIGQAIDDTILKNGEGGINLSNALFHHINAGSRSGKGVMTLNMLASSIASGRPIFYLDNKVDMGSLLANLAHGGGGPATAELSANGPHTFVVNGSNFEKDDFKEFVHRDEWVIQEHIPQEVRWLFGSSSWSTLGELFYLRAYMLCLGIVFARGSDSNGKGDDPMFGGKDGIMVVVDEINQVQTRMLANASIMADVVPPLDSEYQNRLDNIKLSAGNEKERVKLVKLIRSFKRQFNGSAYYALSLLKSYADCIQSIKNKSFSGFRDSEAHASDIFVIGQNLEPIPIGDLNDVLKTSRYKNDTDVGLNKMSNGGNKVRTQSIPYQMTLFKSSDAFIGYNGPQPNYLMQTDERSKAFGVLDKTAKGFAYVPTFATPAEGEKPAEQFCSIGKANDSSTVYFKPYLILNHGDRSVGTYVEDTLKYCAQNGVSNEQVIAEYLDDDPNYSDINRNVGFANYMAMMGLTDLASCLKRSADIANHVVSNYLGYAGIAGSPIPLWLQFVTDLRVEWIFSPQDVWALCTGNSEYNLGKGTKSKISGEYFQYVKDLAELQRLGIDITDESLTPSAISGDGTYCEEDIRQFEDSVNLASEEDGSDSVLEEDAETERKKVVMGDLTEEVDFNSIFSDFDDEEEKAEEPSEVISSVFDFIPSNAEGSYIEDAEPKVLSSEGSISQSDMDEVKKAIETLKKNGINVPLEMGGYVVNTDGSLHTGYEAAPKPSNVNEVFEGVSQDSSNFFETVVNRTTSKVIKDFGGLSRIRSFAVIGGSLVINGVMYRCRVDKSLSDRLYLDLRREVNAGNIAKLFNYSMLAGMTNLNELRCDSASFMYDYINHGAFGSSDVPVEAYFNALPSLRRVQIGESVFTPETVAKDSSVNPFYVKSKATKFFDALHSGSKDWNRSSLAWGKSVLTDKNSKWYQKVLWSPIVLGAVGITAAMRGASAGATAISNAGDVGRAEKAKDSSVKSLMGKFKGGFDAVKNGILDIFNED